MTHSTAGRQVAFRVGLVLAGLVLAGTVWAGGLAVQTTRVLTVAMGRTALMHFQRMARVQVVEPDIVEVVVGSLNDLSIYGKKAGQTTVYVWDKLGMHQVAVTVIAQSPAEGLIEDLKAVLGTSLTYRAAGPTTVIVEGQLPAAQAERARGIIAATARQGIEVVDLVQTEGDNAQGPAGTVAAGLAKILGDKIEYTVWNNTTLVVRGGIGDQEKLAQAHKLLQAVSDTQVKVVDLLEYQESAAQPPVETIAQALGKEFRVWQVAGKTVAVEGSVPDEDRLADLGKLLEAFKDQANVINLVRVGKPDINKAVATLQDLLGNTVSVRPLDSNVIVVEGGVPAEAELTRLRNLVAGFPVGYKVVDLLRQTTPDKRQIMVRVRVVDINRNDLDRLGVNWGQLSFNEDQVSYVDQPWLMHVQKSVFGGSGSVGNVLAIGTQIDALAQKNAAQVLSEPNLLVDDGGKATINVGGEIPVPVAQTGGGGQSGSIAVEWKPFGVIMMIEPTLLDQGNKINLKVEPEVSSLDFSNAVTISGFVLPAIRQRKASTVVTMDNGGTLVLAGLMQKDESKSLRKIPLLGDLPVLGQFFRRRETIKSDNELIILVTPEIVTGPMPIPAQATPPGAPPLTPQKPN